MELLAGGVVRFALGAILALLIAFVVAHAIRIVLTPGDRRSGHRVERALLALLAPHAAPVAREAVVADGVGTRGARRCRRGRGTRGRAASAATQALFLELIACILPWCDSADQCAYTGATPGCDLD